MPRPDIQQYATAETRRKGALAANEKRRQMAMSHRQRIAEKLEAEADTLIAAAVNSAKDGDWRAYIALMEQTFGKPPVEVTGEDGDAIRLEVSDARRRFESRLTELAERAGEEPAPS